MFCFLSHLVEDCYFDEIEMFFFVVGHTHNILDQWFGVLARAIREANFIGSVFALHAIYKIAHDKKVEHLRPKEVHLMETYHDWRKFYAPLLNEDIHHYLIPLRWKLTRDPILSVATAQYMVVSPTAGLTYLEKWQPVASNLGSLDDNGTVVLSLFDTYNGAEALFNAIGINTTTHTSTVDLLTAAASKDVISESVENIASVLPIIRKIEVRAIAETEMRMQQESDTGYSSEKVSLPTEYVKAIDREITRANSSKGGRIVWLRRSKISNDPNYLSRRPDLLPNPDLWKGTLATHATKQKLAEEEAAASGQPKQKVKTDPEVNVAQSRLIAFQNAAAEMASTASLILKLIPSQIDVTDETSDIKKATSSFRRPVLTRREEAWYQSISTANLILQKQRRLVNAEMSKPWELLKIPMETPEQKCWREGIAAERAMVAAKTEARLRKLVHRLGEGEYDPDLQIVTMDGFAPAQTTDVEQMKKPQMLQLARAHKIPNCNKMKVEELRTELKKLIAANPLLVLVPSDEAPVMEVPNISSNIATDAGSGAISASQIETFQPATGPNDILVDSNEGNEEGDLEMCAVMECMEVAAVYCEKCRLNFCQDLHAGHISHSRQTLKDGKTSKSDWEQDKSEAIMMNFHELISSNVVRQSKKRKERLNDNEQPPAIVSKLTSVSNAVVPVNGSLASAAQPTTVDNIFRLPGDNQEKRAAIEKEKLSDAVEFIRALQATKNIKYDYLYGHFNYDNYYDTNFLCILADSMCMDISEVTCKRRYTRKELLDYIIKQMM